VSEITKRGAEKMTFTVRGRNVRSASKRRFIVVAVRPEDITIRAEDEAHRIFGREVGTYVAYHEIVARSDSIATARKRAERARQFHGIGVAIVVVDSTTGEEV
jgi:hypothetical protein